MVNEFFHHGLNGSLSPVLVPHHFYGKGQKIDFAQNRDSLHLIEIKFGTVDCVRKMTLLLNFMHVDPLGAFWQIGEI